MVQRLIPPSRTRFVLAPEVDPLEAFTWDAASIVLQSIAISQHKRRPFRSALQHNEEEALSFRCIGRLGPRFRPRGGAGATSITFRWMRGRRRGLRPVGMSGAVAAGFESYSCRKATCSGRHRRPTQSSRCSGYEISEDDVRAHTSGGHRMAGLRAS